MRKIVRFTRPDRRDEPTDDADRQRLVALFERRLCNCLSEISGDRRPTAFHTEVQDDQSKGWKQLLDLIETAAAKRWEEFAPAAFMSLERWSQIITLPSTIGKLKAVRRFDMYGSSVVRIPPEIGEMENLEEFIPYTSHRLHWFPYEITRCARLADSTISTRSLYGNYKFRPPFPELQPPLPSTCGLDLEDLPPGRYGATSITTCSVCRTSITDAGLYQVWISLNIGTDIVPLLVNACSARCVSQLPRTPADYVSGPHLGGLSIVQPPASHR